MTINQNDLLQDLKKHLSDLCIERQNDFCIALSGGLDSIVLLHLFNRLRECDKNITLTAHHVHHGLSDNGDHWLDFCQLQCEQLNVPFKFSKVNLHKTARTSLEALARDKRYTCLKSGLAKNAFLVTAHHQDDQLETVLLALKRGSGIAGLQGIRSIQEIEDGFLIRPLLIFSRDQLEGYAQRFKLDWIEDESNQDEQFDRNFIRKTISPLLKNRWPAITKTVSRSASILQEQNQIIEDIAIADLSQSLNVESLNQQDEQSSINLNKLACLSFFRQKNALRYWFKTNALEYPSSKQLSVIFDDVIHASEQANPHIEFEHLVLRRYRNNLYLVRKEKLSLPDQPVEWKGEKSLLIEGLLKKLHFNISKNQGVVVNKNSLVEIYFRKHLPAKLTCTPEDRVGNRTIKKLLHEYLVPPWLRDQIPFIFVDGVLKQAVGLWVCDSQCKMKACTNSTVVHIQLL